MQNKTMEAHERFHENLENLRQLFEYERNIIATIREPLIVLDDRLRVISANRSFYTFFQVNPDATDGQYLYELGNGRWNIPQLRELLDSILPQKSSFDNFEVIHVFPKLGRRVMHLNARKMYSKTIDAQLILLAIEDVTEHLQMQNQLKTALHERELLMQEILHRTKNNMSAIISVLHLESLGITDDSMLQIFQNIENRIHAMLLVQSQLYQSHNFINLSLDEYLMELANVIFRNLTIDPEKVSLRCDMESVEMSADTAIPCGLLLNELMTNALKHAFPGNTTGILTVGLHHRENNMCELYVSDNGVGLPEDFDINKPSSLGVQLVTSFVDQVSGTIELVREQGTEWRIRFQERKKGGCIRI